MWYRFATSLCISIHTSVWCLFNLQHENIRIIYRQLHLMKRSCWKTLCKRAQPQLNKLQNRRIKSLRNTFSSVCAIRWKIIHLYLFQLICIKWNIFYWFISHCRNADDVITGKCFRCRWGFYRGFTNTTAYTFAQRS